MTEKAVPTRTVRASLRRQPTIVSASAATVARMAPKPTPQKWTPLPGMYSCADEEQDGGGKGTPAAQLPPRTPSAASTSFA